MGSIGFAPATQVERGFTYLGHVEAILTSSLGASCNTTGVSSENRVWMAFATLSRLKGTAWKTKSSQIFGLNSTDLN